MTDEWARCRRFLADNLRLLLDSADTIASTPEYYWCSPACVHMGGAIGPPREEFPLGALVQAWRSGKLQAPLRATGESVLIHATSGSPLSGHGGLAGICASSGRHVTGHSKDGSDVLAIDPGRLSADYLELLHTIPEKPANVVPAALDDLIRELEDKKP